MQGICSSQYGQEYFKAGVDICCTNTLKANAFGQKDFKTGKLVTEMNKAAALSLGAQLGSQERVLELDKPQQLGLWTFHRRESQSKVLGIARLLFARGLWIVDRMSCLRQRCKHVETSKLYM